MKKFLFIIYFFFISTPLIALEKSGCIDGKIRYLDRKKETELSERYCFDSLLRSISSVKKCADNKECLINLPGPFALKLKDTQGEKGSVGFKVCENLAGTPQLIEFWDGSNWIHTSRCIFRDGSYQDIGALSLKVNYVD